MRYVAAALSMLCMPAVCGAGALAGENRLSAGWCDKTGKKWQRYEFVELAPRFYCEITRIPEEGRTIRLRAACSGQGRFSPLWLVLRREDGGLTISPASDDPQGFGAALGARAYRACGPG